MNLPFDDLLKDLIRIEDQEDRRHRELDARHRHDPEISISEAIEEAEFKP